MKFNWSKKSSSSADAKEDVIQTNQKLIDESDMSCSSSPDGASGSDDVMAASSSFLPPSYDFAHI